MPAPYKREFVLGSFSVTTLVLDRVDFESLVREIVSRGLIMADDAQSMLDAQLIPLIAKGTKTAFLFERFEVSTEKLSVIVRGASKTVLDQILAYQNN